MNRIFVTRWLNMPSLLAGALLTLQADPIALQYSPSPDAAFDIRERVTRVTTASGEDPVTDVRERNSRLVIATPSDTSYANTVTIVSQTLMRNGNPIVSPVYAAMAGLTLTYELDLDGRLVEITGYEQLKDAMSAKLPEKLAGTLLKLLNYDSLRSKDRSSYNEVHDQYAGASIELVTDRASVASHALPYDGSVPLYAASTIEYTDDSTMIRVTRTYNSDAAALAAQFETITEEDLTTLRGTLMQVLPENYESASVSGTEETLVHISGPLVHSRTVNLAYSFTLTPPAGAEPIPFAVTVTEEIAAAPAAQETTQTSGDPAP